MTACIINTGEVALYKKGYMQYGIPGAGSTNLGGDAAVLRMRAGGGVAGGFGSG